MSFAGRVLVYGGRGALGASIVNFFKAKNWWVLAVDLFPNEEAHSNVVISETSSWTVQDAEVQGKVEEVLSDAKLDAILCVAGGWAGGNASSKDLVKNADLMCKQSIWSSVIAASLASKHLKENGLLQLTGASPALDGTSGMMGYGLAKAAVHQFVKSLGKDSQGLPAGTVALAILPVTLDTPNNRKFMANADFSTWTSLEFVANLLYTWSCGQNRPATGSLIQLVTKEGDTQQIPA